MQLLFGISRAFKVFNVISPVLKARQLNTSHLFFLGSWVNQVLLESEESKQCRTNTKRDFYEDVYTILNRI